MFGGIVQIVILSEDQNLPLACLKLSTITRVYFHNKPEKNLVRLEAKTDLENKKFHFSGCKDDTQACYMSQISWLFVIELNNWVSSIS